MLGEVEVRTRTCSCHQPALSGWRRCNLAAAILGPVVSRLQEEKFSVYFFFKLHSFMYMNNTPSALPLVLYWKNKALKDSADLLSVFNITLGMHCVSTYWECYRYRYLIDWNFFVFNRLESSLPLSFLGFIGLKNYGSIYISISPLPTTSLPTESVWNDQQVEM